MHTQSKECITIIQQEIMTEVEKTEVKRERLIE
jgi:hypothetical protein